MKILQISSGVLPVPPLSYGGLEMICFDLSYCLAEKGHEVHIVCSDESTADKYHKNIACIRMGPSQGNAHEWEMNAHNKIMEQNIYNQFEIIHTHDWKKFAYIAKMQNPQLNVISTLHGMCPYNQPPPIPKPCMVGISKSHAQHMSSVLGIPVKHCYNGVDLDKYGFNRNSRNGRYLFLGRINNYKAPHAFLDLIKETMTYGDVVGDDSMVEDPMYVERILLTCNDMHGRATYWGDVSRDRAVEFLQESKAVIMPHLAPWQEPFGLVAIEAMACGTPVLATNNGALTELVKHDITGYLADFYQDLAQYMNDKALNKIKALDCRKQAEVFSRENMCKNYLLLYQKVLEGGW